MPLTVAQLVARVTADTSGFYKSMAVANASMVRTGSIIGRVAAGAGLAVTAMGILSLKAAGDFQQSMNLVKAVAEPTTGQFKAMRTEAINLGNDLRLPAVSAKDAADVMYDLSRSGLSVNDTMGATRGVLLAATAAHISFGDAALATARALKAFNLPGQQANKIADLMAATVNRTTASVQDLTDGWQNASGQFVSAHYNIQTLTTAIAELVDKGISGAQAGTSLKVMLQRLESPTTKAAAVMDKLHISIFNANGSMKPFPAIINQFTNALNGASDKTRAQALNTIFGQRANQAMVKLMQGGISVWDQYSKKIEQSGVAQKLADARMQGFNGSLEKFKNAISTLAIELGTSLLPVATNVVNWGAKFIQGLNVSKIQSTFAVLKNVVVSAFNAIKPFFTFLATTSFGQGILAGVAVFYTLIKAITLAKSAMKSFQLAAAGLGGGGIFGVALAGISLAVGFLAQRFIAGKLAAEQLAQSLMVTKFNADALKSSLDRLSQAHLDLHQAQLNLASATLALRSAHAQWQADLRSGLARTQQGRGDYINLQQAIQQVRQAHLDVSVAAKASTAADAARNKELDAGIIKLRDIREKLIASAQAHDADKLSTDALTKITANNLDVLTQVIRAETNHANALRKTDPVAAAAARRTVEYATSLADTLKEARPATQSTEDFIRSLTKLPMPLVDVGNKAKDMGGKVKSGLDGAAKSAKSSGDSVKNNWVKAIQNAVTQGGSQASKAAKLVGTNLSSSIGPAKAAGSQTGAGYVAGLSAYIGAAAAAGARIAAAAVASMHTTLQTHSPSKVTDKIGQDTASGFINGFVRYFKENEPKLKQPLVKAILEWGAIRPYAEAAARVLGVGAVRGIINGVLGTKQTLTQQLRQALSDAVQQAIQAANQKVQDMESQFASAFGNLASAALAEFDAKIAQWQPAASKILDKLQLADQIKQIGGVLGDSIMGLYQMIVDQINNGNFTAADQLTQNLVNQIQANIAAAQQALDTASQNLQAVLADPNATQEQKDAAQKAYDDAKQKLDDLVAARNNILQIIADQEKTAHDKLMAQKRDELQAELEQLQRELAKHPKEYDKIMKKALALIKRYLPDYKSAGKEIGESIAQGLRDSIKDVENAADAVAAAIAARLKTKSPTEEGPMSDLDRWWEGFTPTLLEGLDFKPITEVVEHMVTPPDVMPSAVAGGGEGNNYFNVAIHTPSIIGNDLEGAARELQGPIRKIFIDLARSNGLR